MTGGAESSSVEASDNPSATVVLTAQTQSRYMSRAYLAVLASILQFLLSFASNHASIVPFFKSFASHLQVFALCCNDRRF